MQRPSRVSPRFRSNSSLNSMTGNQRVGVPASSVTRTASMNQRAQRKNPMEQYVVFKKLASGHCSDIHLAVHVHTQEKRVIKSYAKAKLCDLRRKAEVKREINVLQKLAHKNTISFVETFDTLKALCIVMEYASGISLWEFVKNKQRLGEDEAKPIFRQLLEGIDYCHRNNIAHRDIKLENVLIDENNNLKVIDFGFATCMPKHKKTRMFCGTAFYLAPEIISNKEYSGHNADVWALGILLYTVLVGAFPFSGNNENELFDMIAKGLFYIPSQLTSEAKELIASILVKNPDQRPTCAEILQHPWMQSFVQDTPMDEVPEISN